MDKITEYIAKYLKDALRVEYKYATPAIVALAQSALESGYGTAKPGNMMFGIKANASWKGQKQLLRTTEILSNPNVKFPEVISVTPLPDGKYEYVVKDWFRAYNSPYESFEDWAKFLITNSRYKKAFAYKDNPLSFVKEIVKAGYATDPDYLKKITSIINTIIEKKKNFPKDFPSV